MGVSISGQAAVFLQAGLLGVCAGVVYDFMRVIRGRIRRAAATAILDFLFWLLVIVTVFWFVMSVLDGVPRIYAGVGILLGLTFYYLLVSKWFLKAGFYILDGILFIAAAVARPFRAAGRGIWIFSVRATSAQRDRLKFKGQRRRMRREFGSGLPMREEEKRNWGHEARKTQVDTQAYHRRNRRLRRDKSSESPVEDQ